jgi:hypothetical protein
MDALTITFVTACSALVSATVGPLVSIVVASKQIRASLVSTNRQRWIEALRDSIAEYVALAVSAAMLREVLRKDAFQAIRDDPQLAQLAERLALARNRTLLMLNPAKAVHHELSRAIEEAGRLLLESEATLGQMNDHVEVITRTGRAVLQVEWTRVKRGD